MRQLVRFMALRRRRVVRQWFDVGQALHNANRVGGVGWAPLGTAGRGEEGKGEGG